MAKAWDIRIDEQNYSVKLKGGKVLINGEKLVLNRKYKKKTGLVHEEYEFPIGSKTALLVMKNLSSPQLVIDGVDCATGEKYVPFKMPWWSYIFVVLHLINFMNGAIGGLMAVVGVGATTAVSTNTRMNVLLRVLLDAVILVLAYAIVFAIAFAVAGVAY